MRIFILLAFCLTSVGCAVSVNLPQEKIDQIPEDANRIDIYTNESTEESFAHVRQFLTDRGYTIKNENDLNRRMETDLQEVGQRTKLSITLRVAPIENGSKIEAIGTWSSDVEESSFQTMSQNVSSENVDYSLANWGGTNRAKFAYSELVRLFDEYPAQEIRYVKQ